MNQIGSEKKLKALEAFYKGDLEAIKKFAQDKAFVNAILSDVTNKFS